MNIIQKINVCALLSLSVLSAKAQTTYMEMEQLTVNDQVTTVITASEPIRFVDISTDKVVGDQPINNTIRLKPKDNVYADGEVLAIVTIVTERYRTQYALLYTTRMQEAVTDKEIECSERNAYNNPAVSLSTADMTKYARQIWSSSAKYRNVATKMHRMVMRLNNIYSVGEYFFIDFSVENKTNIRFDIDEMRIKLSDKKAEQGYQCADSGTDPISCVGRCEDLQVWLSQRDCGEEDDLPQRQGADHRAVGKTDKWTHHLAQHRL